MARRKQILLLAGLVALAATVAIVYYRIDPARVAWMPRCPFRWITGWQCPACGNQRALHALLHGRLASAFGFNPFFILSLPYLVALVAARLVRSRHPRPYRALAHPAVVRAYLVLIILWWLLRNLA